MNALMSVSPTIPLVITVKPNCTVAALKLKRHSLIYGYLKKKKKKSSCISREIHCIKLRVRIQRLDLKACVGEVKLHLWSPHQIFSEAQSLNVASAPPG